MKNSYQNIFETKYMQIFNSFCFFLGGSNFNDISDLKTNFSGYIRKAFFFKNKISYENYQEHVRKEKRKNLHSFDLLKEIRQFDKMAKRNEFIYSAKLSGDKIKQEFKTKDFVLINAKFNSFSIEKSHFFEHLICFGNVKILFYILELIIVNKISLEKASMIYQDFFSLLEKIIYFSHEVDKEINHLLRDNGIAVISHLLYKVFFLFLN